MQARLIEDLLEISRIVTGKLRSIPGRSTCDALFDAMIDPPGRRTRVSARAAFETSRCRQPAIPTGCSR